MSQTAQDVISLARGRHLQLGIAGDHRTVQRRFDHAALAGRLVEVSGDADSAVLTAAFDLLWSAQQAGETTAWVTCRHSSFFPPDAERFGIDLDALVIARVPRVADVARAADKLARSGAFGLIVCDLGSDPLAGGQLVRVPAPLLSRLLGLARKHQAAVVFLTTKREADASLGSIISLRGCAHKESAAAPVGSKLRPLVSGFRVQLRVIKDKRTAPGWGSEEVCHGPPGLR